MRTWGSADSGSKDQYGSARTRLSPTLDVVYISANGTVHNRGRAGWHVGVTARLDEWSCTVQFRAMQFRAMQDRTGPYTCWAALPLPFLAFYVYPHGRGRWKRWRGRGPSVSLEYLRISRRKEGAATCSVCVGVAIEVQR